MFDEEDPIYQDGERGREARERRLRELCEELAELRERKAELMRKADADGDTDFARYAADLEWARDSGSGL